MGREGSEKALHLCKAAKTGLPNRIRAGKPAGQEAAAASIAAADNSIYITRELIFLVVHCLFRLCSEHSAAVGALMHFEIFDI